MRLRRAREDLVQRLIPRPLQVPMPHEELRLPEQRVSDVSVRKILASTLPLRPVVRAHPPVRLDLAGPLSGALST
jgi:hypothetical protein